MNDEVLITQAVDLAEKINENFRKMGI